MQPYSLGDFPQQSIIDNLADRDFLFNPGFLFYLVQKFLQNLVTHGAVLAQCLKNNLIFSFLDFPDQRHKSRFNPCNGTKAPCFPYGMGRQPSRGPIQRFRGFLALHPHTRFARHLVSRLRPPERHY